MSPGDHVFCVFENRYRFLARVVSKAHDEALAESIWGRNEATGRTWEHMYFLTLPRAIDVPVSALEDLLPRGYRGFTRIADHRVADVERRYGSVRAFLDQRVLGESTSRRGEPGLLTVLRDYADANVIFESSARGRRYRVGAVDTQGAIIQRVDGGEPERVNEADFVSFSTSLSRNGALALTTVPGNRLQGATFAQGENVGLSVDRKDLIDITRDAAAADFFADHLASLRVDRSGDRPKLYKPVMLDVVITGIDDGSLEQNRIPFDWVLQKFLERMSDLGEPADESAAAYAYANLAGDVLWLLAYRRDATPLDASSISASSIRTRVRYARLKDRLWTLLQKKEHRDALQRSLRESWFEPMNGSVSGLSTGFDQVLNGYLAARSEPFNGQHEMSQLFKRLVAIVEDLPPVAADARLRVIGSVGRGNWAAVPWLAVVGPDESIRDGVYCVYLFRRDMTGVYATFNQGVTRVLHDHGTPEGRSVLKKRAESLRQYCGALTAAGFAADGEIDLRVDQGLGLNYESSTVSHKLYPSGDVPDDAALTKDLEALVTAYQEYLDNRGTVDREPDDLEAGQVGPDFSLADGVEAVIQHIASRGFRFQPWHIAQYITAVRTKPFTILAGITGTGKSKLPALVAEATGSRSELVPVRPDWTDSSDVLGYVDLQGTFRPGRVLEVVRDALNNSDRHAVCIIDEMNLARVEQYFAEILSHIEDRRPDGEGGFASGALLGQSLGQEDEEWASICLPSNLALVGTVNMDESAHGFSRKVLDRAFTLELSDVDLTSWRLAPQDEPSEAVTWPTSAWAPRAIMLGQLRDVSDAEAAVVDDVVRQLSELNSILRRAQLQLGYRSRDEIALFVLHAREIAESFRDLDGAEVSPMDLAIQMKVLPRILGGSNGIRRVIAGLLGWAHDGSPREDEDVDSLVTEWETAGRPDTSFGSRLPRTSARLCLMWRRLEDEGFTSFWL